MFELPMEPYAMIQVSILLYTDTAYCLVTFCGFLWRFYSIYCVVRLYIVISQCFHFFALS